MKKSFIEALYYGNINLDNLGFRPGGPVHQRVEKANRAEDALRETMTDRQKALFRVYYDAQMEVRMDETLDSFLHGFRLGGQCIYDVFLDTEAPYDMT